MAGWEWRRFIGREHGEWDIGGFVEYIAVFVVPGKGNRGFQHVIQLGRAKELSGAAC